MKKSWYAIYVKSRCEKKVFQELCKRNINAYLPLHKELRQWSDRKKLVEIPLINSYLFVNVDDTQYYNILTIPGVVRYVCFSGKAVPIPERQLICLKLFLEQAIDVEVVSSNKDIGNHVEFKSGPFKGFFGRIINKKRFKFVVQLEEIGYNILITVPMSYIEKTRHD